MKNLIIDIVKQNAEYLEFLKYRNGDKNDTTDHKYSNFIEKQSTEFLFIDIKDSSRSKTKKEIKSIHFSKEEGELILEELVIEKKVNYNNDIFDVEYTFSIDEFGDYSSVNIKIKLFEDELFFQIDESFEIIGHSLQNPLKSIRDTSKGNFKKLKESFSVLCEIENPEIIKAYLELFIFNKPIKQEEKELFLISSDINLNDLEIIEHFGYDFRQDMINAKNLTVNNNSNKNPKLI